MIKLIKILLVSIFIVGCNDTGRQYREMGELISQCNEYATGVFLEYSFSKSGERCILNIKPIGIGRSLKCSLDADQKTELAIFFGGLGGVKNKLTVDLVLDDKPNIKYIVDGNMISSPFEKFIENESCVPRQI